MRYVPYTQPRDFMANFVVRTGGSPIRFTAVMKQAIASTDHTQTAYDIEPLETLVSNSLAGRRLIVWMLAAFAGLSLLLALVGIYGLISYITSQRTKEIGIRMALGAQQSSVVWLVQGKVIQ